MPLVKASYSILNISGADLYLINTARSVCYKSEIDLNKAEMNVELAIKHGHETLIEYGSMTVKFIVDRGISHELVRHRLCTYSQESTRWCNYSGQIEFIIPPWVDLRIGDTEIDDPASRAWYDSMYCAEKDYHNLIRLGWKPEQARSVLPNSLKTVLIMHANFREWRTIFKQRALGLTGRPHPQMLEVMVPLLEEVREAVPAVFGDLK